MVSDFEYNPARFRGLVMRMHSSRCVASIYSTGKVVLVGVQSIEAAEVIATRLTDIISNCVGETLLLRQLRLRSINACFDAGFSIRLAAFSDKHSSRSTYEPDLYSGLVYRVPAPTARAEVKLMIFVSGLVLLTGANSMESLLEAANHILPLLLEFRKQHIPWSS